MYTVQDSIGLVSEGIHTSPYIPWGEVGLAVGVIFVGGRPGDRNNRDVHETVVP